MMVLTLVCFVFFFIFVAYLTTETEILHSICTYYTKYISIAAVPCCELGYLGDGLDEFGVLEPGVTLRSRLILQVAKVNDGTNNVP